MNIDLNRKIQKTEHNSFIESFIKELTKTLDNLNMKKELEVSRMDDIRLTQDEELELYRKETKFLQNFFEKELMDLSKGEVFIVTDKFENDFEYNRYKVTQYKDNFECKYVVLKKDLPENIHLGDVVRKINGNYFFDVQATQYIKEEKNKIRQEIINNRKI